MAAGPGLFHPRDAAFNYGFTPRIAACGILFTFLDRSFPLRLRPLAAAILLTLAAALPAQAQVETLPDMGSSAAEQLTPQEEAEYGAYTLYQLRRMDMLLEDPLVEDWLAGMGHRLAAASDRPEQEFTFFLMRERQINAFATLGGYVGTNAGLILAAETEDEVAGVLSHEIAHVTQRHVLRAVERARKDQLPILLATLGVILASRGSDDSSDAAQAAIIGGQALMAQRQIDYTRSNESEADRIGIQTLAHAGYDVAGMGDFFERLEKQSRGNSGGYVLPDYLRSHPVTTTRISEARDRADRLRSSQHALPSGGSAPAPLLLPPDLQARSGAGTNAPVKHFAWARERLRVLSAVSPKEALREYDLIAEAAGGTLTDAQRYGQALAQLRQGQPGAAEATLQALARRAPDHLWIELALAETAHGARKEALARERFDALLRSHPQHHAVSLSYAIALNEIGTDEAGRRAQAVLRPLLAAGGQDALLQKNFARASLLAGDEARAGEAFAESAFLNGRAEDALAQLTDLLKREDLDYVQRARIEARIAEITPIVLEMRRQGIRPEDQEGA
jgi:predicted Zn-dependent protease